jgi:predicted component of type VI protein secretion system
MEHLHAQDLPLKCFPFEQVLLARNAQLRVAAAFAIVSLCLQLFRMMCMQLRTASYAAFLLCRKTR